MCLSSTFGRITPRHFLPDHLQGEAASFVAPAELIFLLVPSQQLRKQTVFLAALKVIWKGECILLHCYSLQQGSCNKQAEQIFCFCHKSCAPKPYNESSLTL